MSPLKAFAFKAIDPLLLNLSARNYRGKRARESFMMSYDARWPPTYSTKSFLKLKGQSIFILYIKKINGNRKPFLKRFMSLFAIRKII